MLVCLTLLAGVFGFGLVVHGIGAQRRVLYEVLESYSFLLDRARQRFEADLAEQRAQDAVEAARPVKAAASPERAAA